MELVELILRELPEKKKENENRILSHNNYSRKKRVSKI